VLDSPLAKLSNVINPRITRISRIIKYYITVASLFDPAYNFCHFGLVLFLNHESRCISGLICTNNF